MYLNSFYFGMFATCEIGKFLVPLCYFLSNSQHIVGMGTLKAANLQYDQHNLVRDSCVLLATCLLESIRIHFGRKGSLSDHGWQVILSVFLTIPCAAGVIFLLLGQQHNLRLEIILCGLMVLLQFVELVFATLFLFSLCKQPTYD